MTVGSEVSNTVACMQVGTASTLINVSVFFRAVPGEVGSIDNVRFCVRADHFPSVDELPNRNINAGKEKRQWV